MMSSSSSAAALDKKKEGNEAFKAKDFETAVARYTEAIELDQTDHTFFSNRAMALLAIGRYEEAVADGRKCISLKPDFMKGFHRAATGLIKLERYEEAAKVCEKGLIHHADNRDLKTLLTEARAGAERKVAASRKGASKAELLKVDGDTCFRSARFEDAIAKYTEALECVESLSSPLAVSVLNNRAACNQQLSNFGAVVDDTTMVLETDASNVKALLRRALAYEGLERYRAALADVRQVLTLAPGHKVANSLQHRLGKAVRTLKAEAPTI